MTVSVYLFAGSDRPEIDHSPFEFCGVAAKLGGKGVEHQQSQYCLYGITHYPTGFSFSNM